MPITVLNYFRKHLFPLPQEKSCTTFDCICTHMINLLYHITVYLKSYDLFSSRDDVAKMENTGQTNDRFFSNSSLSSLQQTIYILKRLTQTNSLEQIIVAASGNDDEQLVKRFLKFLQDMNWVEKDERQLWVITEKGGIWLKEIEDAMETQKRA